MEAQINTVEKKIDTLLNMVLRFTVHPPEMRISISRRFTYKVSLAVTWPDRTAACYYGYEFGKTDDQLPLISLEEGLDTIYVKIKLDLGEKAAAYACKADDLIKVFVGIDQDLGGKYLGWKKTPA
jgi:hypothetical protein